MRSHSGRELLLFMLLTYGCLVATVAAAVTYEYTDALAHFTRTSSDIRTIWAKLISTGCHPPELPSNTDPIRLIEAWDELIPCPGYDAHFPDLPNQIAEFKEKKYDQLVDEGYSLVDALDQRTATLSGSMRYLWPIASLTGLPRIALTIVLSIVAGAFGASLARLSAIVGKTQPRKPLIEQIAYGGMLSFCVWIVVTATFAFPAVARSGPDYVYFAALGALAGVSSEAAMRWLEQLAKSTFAPTEAK